MELHVLAKYALRAYEYVDATLGEVAEHLLDIGCRACTRQVVNTARHVLEPVAERMEVLVCQDGCRHQHSHLLVISHSLEGCTYGDFGLAEAHIATHQTVHGPFALHVGLHIGSGTALVGRILIEERGFELLLQEAVGAKAEALLLTSGGIELYQVACYVLYLLLRALLELLPCSCAQAVKAWSLIVATFVFRHLVQGVYGHEDHIVVLIDYLHHLLRGVACGYAHQTDKASYAMVYVHHIVSRLELAEFLQAESHLAATHTVALEAVLMETVEDLMVCEDADFQVIVAIALMHRMLHRSEDNGGIATVVEDGTQAVGLLRAVTTYI